MSLPASGTSYTLRSGEYEASLASVGATLRSLTHDGRDLVVPFAADIVRPAHRGATLAPWPNRIVDGRYVFGGVEYQTALTEPRRSHALHGLVTWLDFAAVKVAEDAVTLVATISPQVGYPWRVRVETTFALTSDGLTQTVVATNESDSEAPFGTGPHPYLVAGPHPLDTWTLSLPADQVLEVTPDRLAPVALAPVTVDADRFDFRDARPIGAAEIDHAFTDLTRDGGDIAAVRVRDEDAGTGVEMSWGGSCPWVQVHTADQPGGAGTPGHRIGLAVEPMTCAPDAFNADRYDYDAGLIVIPAGDSVTASWRIAAL